MNKRFFLLIFLSLILLNCSNNDDPASNETTCENLNISSQFNILNVINDKEITSTIKTNDGGYIGIANSGDYDILKFDSNFNLLWNKTYGGSERDNAQSIIQTNDGGYLVIGKTRSTDGDISQNYGDYDIWVCKLDIDGDLVWEKNYGGSQGDGINKENSLIQNEDGNYFFIAYTKSNNHNITLNHGGYDVWLVKINSIGEIIFEKTFGGSDNDYGIKIIKNNNNYNLLINASSVNGDFNESGNWVVQIDEGGIIDWKTNLFGINPGSICTTTNDEIIAINTDFKGFFLNKLDSDGNIILSNTISFQSISNKQPTADKIIETSNNGFIILGDLGNGNDQDAIVFRVSCSFNEVYNKIYGGNYYDKSSSLISLDNNFVYQLITLSTNLEGINHSGRFSSVFIDFKETQN